MLTHEYAAAEDLPPAIRMTLRVLLEHIEPGWDNCRAIMLDWLEGNLDCDKQGHATGVAIRAGVTTRAEFEPPLPGSEIVIDGVKYIVKNVSSEFVNLDEGGDE